MDPSMVGTWLLAAATSVTGEIALSDGTPEESGVDTWLYGNSHHLLKEASPIEGLTLEIAADATFTETKTRALNFSWYDSEGVLDEHVTPFSGTITAENNIYYLHLHTPISWATPNDAVRKARVRYDDGDTIICDKIELIQAALVRTISVVTDELYLDRTILIYRR